VISPSRPAAPRTLTPAVPPRDASRGHTKEDRPRKYEELVASGQLEKHLVDPTPPNLVKAFKVFGFRALDIGLTLIVVIIWTERFTYTKKNRH
jgi:hypothetical protein